LNRRTVGGGQGASKKASWEEALGSSGERKLRKSQPPSGAWGEGREELREHKVAIKGIGELRGGKKGLKKKKNGGDS